MYKMFVEHLFHNCVFNMLNYELKLGSTTQILIDLIIKYGVNVELQVS